LLSPQDNYIQIETFKYLKEVYILSHFGGAPEG